jgi:cation diffusion facilitator family transporter
MSSQHNHQAQDTGYTGGHAAGHGHTHGTVDPAIFASARGIWATKWSLIALLATAALQTVVVVLTGSVALLADTVRNFGDAATAIPLWIAFSLTRKAPTKRFSYGYGRDEDLAGLFIVGVILASGVYAAYVSASRLSDPPTVEFLWAVAAAALIGFLGNEAVALFRIKIGKEIASTALIADGYHARVDGLTSLAVLLGALGVWLGYPLADPIVGLVISAAILKIVVSSAKLVLARLLDGVEPGVVDEVRQVAEETSGVVDVSEVRVRWLGHRMLAEVNIAVRSSITVEEGHGIAQQVHHELLHGLQYLSNATIHVDPRETSGEEHHPRPGEHHSDGIDGQESEHDSHSHH